ncbi:MAG TPA: hypothetical protein VHB20_04615 [Verrucomicrobiae bacterium]|nr:hypothetical protein [Verrucomicrobiae bacterium]
MKHNTLLAVEPPVGPSKTAPSLRVPVTAANRALLRWLRAAELAAWETGKQAVQNPFDLAHPAKTRHS